MGIDLGFTQRCSWRPHNSNSTPHLETKVRNTLIVTAAVILLAGGEVIAQNETNPDYRIRAKFRNVEDQSVGNADFRIQSRFMQLYYGGVVRQDDFKFKISLDSTDFANQVFDIIIMPDIATNFLIGTVTANTSGIVDVTWRNPFNPASDPPDREFPDNFPEPVEVGNIVKIFESGTSNLILSAELEEKFVRGDVNQDGKVDLTDFTFLETNFGQSGVGPANGDFTGDNLSNTDDYDLFVTNWTESTAPPAEPQSVPEPASVLIFGLGITMLLGGRRRKE